MTENQSPSDRAQQSSQHRSEQLDKISDFATFAAVVGAIASAAVIPGVGLMLGSAIAAAVSGITKVAAARAKAHERENEIDNVDSTDESR